MVLPVELSLVPDCVSSYEDVCNALRHAVHLCELLANQQGYIPNTYCLRVSLLQHLLTAVIPLPLPCSHPQRASRCFWAASPMRYETQADLLRLLNLACRHFAACCFSIRVTRSFDAVRLVVVATIATLADAVMRIRCADVPSLLCLNYSGEAEGPGDAFHFELGSFAVESEDLQLASPELHCARTRVLDYFAAQRPHHRPSRVLFGFERSMEFGVAEEALLRQLCLHMAFPTATHGQTHAGGSSLLPAYLSGESRLLLENFPELGFFRDMVFLFKMLMVPTSEALPEICPWMPLDALLSWRHDASSGAFVVSAFGRTLNAAAITKQAEQAENSSWLERKLRKVFGVTKPRAPPSSADPQQLVKSELGVEVRIEREEDVLHLKQLPSFDGALRPPEAELLLQYLTVPYLRVPLLLRFFSQPSHVHALGSAKLQAALDATLFEPGQWQLERSKELPKCVPAPSRAHLATPAGILFNELTKSPAAVTESVLRMVELAIELDSGRYSTESTNCSAILYVLRMAVRVEGFIRSVLAANPPDGAPPTVEPARGLQLDLAALGKLRRCSVALRRMLRRELHALLEQWNNVALREREMSAACTLFAHLAFVYKHIEEDEIDYQALSTLLCAQVFLGNNHTFDAEPDLASKGTKRSFKEEAVSDAALGMPQTELFEIFARHRCKLLRALEANPKQRNEAMEAVVRTVTRTQPRACSAGRVPEPSLNLLGAALPQVTCTGPRVLSSSRAANELEPRSWQQHAGFRGLGRYLPDTTALEAATSEALTPLADDAHFEGGAPPADAAAAGAPNGGRRRRGDALEEWLRQMTTTNGANAEVNVQFGEFSLRKQTLGPLPPHVRESPDFAMVFGEDASGPTAEPMQAVRVSSTAQRDWYHLVGNRADVHIWTADTRSPPLAGCRAYPRELRASERWVQEAIQRALIPDRMAGLELALVLPDYSTSHFALLSGATAPPSAGAGAGQPAARQFKEIVVLREGLVVHVYDLLEHGRRWWRSLAWSSDAAVSLHNLSPRTVEARGSRVHTVMGSLQRSVPPAPSVVISRRLTAALGKQVFVPPRLLYGLIPTALLSAYDLWQNEDGSLIGDVKPGHPIGDALRTRLAVSLSEVGGTVSGAVRRLCLVDEPTPEVGGPNAASIVPRVAAAQGASSTFAASSAAATAEVDTAKPAHTLLNLLLAAPGSPLRSLALRFGRLEDLSHVLAWSEEDGLAAAAAAAAGAGAAGEASLEASLIELPRLGLTFHARGARGAAEEGAGGRGLRLYCAQHEGFYLSHRSSPGISELLRGVPHSLLLEKDGGSLSLLVSACARPRRAVLAAGQSAAAQALSRLFPCEVELDNNDEHWVASLGPTKAYLYPVHLSQSFLFFPSLAAALYMLLLKLLARRYETASEMAPQCVCDRPLSREEAQIVALFNETRGDQHPDAHACRLRISLHALHTPLYPELPWDLAEELIAYTRKLGHVSLLLRLSVYDELVLLTHLSVTLNRQEVGLKPQAVQTRDTVPLMVGSVMVKMPKPDPVAEAAVAAGLPTPRDARALPNVLQSRLTLLTAASTARPDADSIDVELPCPAFGGGPHFDAVQDRTSISGEGLGALFGKFEALSYSRPENPVGREAASALDRWLRNGLELRGGRDQKGFLFLYELMRGDVFFKLLSNDSGHTLGCFLLRLLPASEWSSKGVLMSTLRVMAHNPQLARHLPKFEDDRNVKVSVMFRGQDVLAKLFEKLTLVLKGLEADGHIQWPLHSFPALKLQPLVRLPAPLLARVHGADSATPLPLPYRRWLWLSDGAPSAPRRLRLASCAEGEADALAGTPLRPIDLSRLVVERTRSQRGLPPLEARLPFALSSHPAAQSDLAAAMIRRLEEDFLFHTHHQNELALPELVGFTDAELRAQATTPSGCRALQDAAASLVERLQALLQRDNERMLALVEGATRLANQAGEPAAVAGNLIAVGGATEEAAAEQLAGFALGRAGGNEAELGFHHLVRLLACSRGESELLLLNPYLSREQAARVSDETALALLTANRIAQSLRCLDEARGLQVLLLQLQAPPRPKNVSTRASASGRRSAKTLSPEPSQIPLGTLSNLPTGAARPRRSPQRRPLSSASCSAR